MPKIKKYQMPSSGLPSNGDNTFNPYGWDQESIITGITPKENNYLKGITDWNLAKAGTSWGSQNGLYPPVNTPGWKTEPYVHNKQTSKNSSNRNIYNPSSVNNWTSMIGGPKLNGGMNLLNQNNLFGESFGKNFNKTTMQGAAADTQMFDAAPVEVGDGTFGKGMFDGSYHPSIPTPIESGNGSTGTDDKKAFGQTDFGKGLKSVGKGLVGSAPGVAEIGIKALGGREATLQGAGDQAFNQFTTVAWKGALKTGNPWLIAGAGVLKGVDFLNRYAGSTAKKQGTDANMGIIGYDTQISANAGAKATLANKIFGRDDKVKGINQQTRFADRSNILAKGASYQSQQNQMAAGNTYGDIATRTQQRLMGGIGTNVLAARKGTKIPPKSLSNIKKKAQRKVQGAVKEVEKTKETEQLHVIPEGALHARKNNYEGELAKQVTHKGIPVITYEEGDKIKQHAEIEHSEIIFNKDISTKLENLFKEYKNASDKEKKELEIECGKFLTSEIMEKTVDNVGLLEG